jgi:hypothetical protein
LPVPSQTPSVPQLGARWSPQPPAGSGEPLATGVQVPPEPGSAQERQAPEQAVAQHTPWAQMLDIHSPGFDAEHGSPFAFLPQDPERHMKGDWHSLLLEQRCPQRLPLHR